MGKYVPKPLRVETNPVKLDDQLKFYIRTGNSVMLHGPSGVGKSRRVLDVDPDSVMIQLRDGILPEEIIGKTAFDGKNTHWIEPTWYTRIKKICEEDPKHNHVLFIDELTNVRPYEQSLVYNIVLEHSIEGNKGKLPDNCVVIAAGNSPEESEAAYNMPEPLFRRFVGHIYLTPDVRSFVEWGSKLKNGRPRIHPLVSAFVSEFDQEVFYTSYDKEGANEFAIDPRGWEQVSNIIYENNEVVQLELLASKMGKMNADMFLRFARNVSITPDQIISGNYQERFLPTSSNGKHALVCTLRNVDKKDRPAALSFVKRNCEKKEAAILQSLWDEDDQELAEQNGAEDENFVG